MSGRVATSPGLDALAPAVRFVLLLTQAGVLTDLARRGVPIAEAEAVRMRHEWRRCVSELGPGEARRRLFTFAETWALGGTCGFCGDVVHDAGVLACPAIPGAGGRDA